MRKTKLAGALGACLLLAYQSANAVSINGSVEIGGPFQPVDDGSPANVVGLDVATGVEFTNNGLVLDSSGDLSGLAFGQSVTMTDFQFDPSLSPNPVTVWSTGGFSFTMDSVTINTSPRSTTELSLSGTGTVSGTGYDDTPGQWNFTAQTANDVTFSWSSSTVSAVPVPAAVWLFGSGLVGLAGVARRSA